MTCVGAINDPTSALHHYLDATCEKYDRVASHPMFNFHQENPNLRVGQELTQKSTHKIPSNQFEI